MPLFQPCIAAAVGVVVDTGASGAHRLWCSRVPMRMITDSTPHVTRIARGYGVEQHSPQYLRQLQYRRCICRTCGLAPSGSPSRF